MENILLEQRNAIYYTAAPSYKHVLVIIWSWSMNAMILYTFTAGERLLRPVAVIFSVILITHCHSTFRSYCYSTWLKVVALHFVAMIPHTWDQATTNTTLHELIEHCQYFVCLRCCCCYRCYCCLSFHSFYLHYNSYHNDIYNYYSII